MAESRERHLWYSLTDPVSPAVNLGGEQKHANGCHVFGICHKHVLLFTRASVYISQTNVLKLARLEVPVVPKGGMEDSLTVRSNLRR